VQPMRTNHKPPHRPQHWQSYNPIIKIMVLRAYVLDKLHGVWYEVDGSHCSCYGLEGQWEPQETNVEALKLRLATGSFDYDEGRDLLCKMLIKEYLGA